MFDKFKQYMTRRQFGARTITSVALSSLFAGLLMASNVQWTPMPMAQALDQKATRVVGTSTIPNSFAELAERLGPTVVNIQVTKVAPAGDVQGMPGLDGPSTLGRMRGGALPHHVPVIFLTAKVGEEERERLISLGATGVLTKPFDPMTLPQELQLILDQ